MEKSIYSLKEVEKATLEYFQGNKLATATWIKKYCLRDENDNLLERTPDDMHHRLAKEFARIEQKYKNPLSEETIYEFFKNFKYIVPQGSPMYGIGNNYSITSLSNCFVIGSNNNADSYGSIMRTDEEQVHLMKRRGGVGHDISHLRPGGAAANNIYLEGLAGATLYMERYSNTTREVAQGGRRGALMLSMDVKHPDADKFIDAKLEGGKVTGANISVKISDSFMKAVEDDSDFYQVFPTHININEISLPSEIKYDKLYKAEYGKHIVYFKKIKAKALWNKIIRNAWQSAEPGVLFWDTVLRESPTVGYGEDWKEVSTNPCVVGDTLILTTQGWLPIRDLNEYPGIYIVTKSREGALFNSKLGWVGVTDKTAFIFEIKFVKGEVYRVNSTHKYYRLNDFSKVEVQNLLPGDKVVSFLDYAEVEYVKNLNIVEPVYDLTATPNYNFFAVYDTSLLPGAIEDLVVINTDAKFNYYEVVALEDGNQKFAFELKAGDRIKFAE